MNQKLILFLALIFFSIFFRLTVLEPYRVLTSEMAPTLLKNDYVIVQKYFYGFKWFKNYLWKWNQPKRGDVILFKMSGSFRLRRVIALPGDRLFYSGGVLFINEKAYPTQPPQEVKKEWEFLKSVDFLGESETGGISNYVHWQEELSRGPYSVLLEKNPKISFGPYKIPSHYYFVMGDHRAKSRDSRTWPSYFKASKGEVVFYRKKDVVFGPVPIPKGTVLFINEDHWFPLFFETQKTVILEGQRINVPVQAVHPGPRGNISKGAPWSIHGLLSDQLIVRNEESFFGGEDQSLVSYDSIYGRAWRIIWGCEKSLPFLNFLCHFKFFRQGRWFWPVHKD